MQYPTPLGLDGSTAIHGGVLQRGVTGQFLASRERSQVELGFVIDDESQGAIGAMVKNENHAPREVGVTQLRDRDQEHRVYIIVGE